MLHLLAVLIFGVIVLQTDRCNCVCGKPLTQKIRKHRSETSISLYTRDGVIEATHLEYRCMSASRPVIPQCRNGHFYGYYTDNRDIHFNEDALARQYLITSRKTG